MDTIPEIKVLDKGFVRLRNISGPTRRIDTPYDAQDVDPANSARMSFGQADSERTLEEELRLANYLIKNWHNTPIEMIVCWLEMKLPIFVARQFVRHRTVSINEISGRYVQLTPDWYIPKTIGGKAAKAKQGQDDNLPRSLQQVIRDRLDTQCSRSYSEYQYAIQNGVAMEHARLFLHLNHYTQWLWRQDLHNIMNLMALRLDKHAQVEAQAYAQAIYDLLSEYLPNLIKLFDEHRRIK